MKFPDGDVKFTGRWCASKNPSSTQQLLPACRIWENVISNNITAETNNLFLESNTNTIEWDGKKEEHTISGIPIQRILKQRKLSTGITKKLLENEILFVEASR